MDNGSNATLKRFIPIPKRSLNLRFLTSNYGAQYGRNGSGTVEVETKSGTSGFHGSAFEYLRNDMFNARALGVRQTIRHIPTRHIRSMTLATPLVGPFYIPNHYKRRQEEKLFSSGLKNGGAKRILPQFFKTSRLTWSVLEISLFSAPISPVIAQMSQTPLPCPLVLPHNRS